MQAVLLLATALQRPEVLAVKLEPGANAAVLKVLASGPVGEVVKEEAGDDVIVSFDAATPDALALPAPAVPIEALSLDPLAPRFRLRLRVARGATVEALATGSLLTVDVRAATGADKSAPRDVDQLYALLFPQATQEAAPVSVVETSKPPSETREPLQFGRFTLTPALTIRYVDGESTFTETPQPVRARYLEFLPRIELATPLLRDGRFSAAYEPRLRRGADAIPLLGIASHFVTVSLEAPVGSALRVSASDRWGRGTIETQVVDPGREYFYDIGRFKRNEVALTLRTDSPGRVNVEAGGFFARETVDPGTAYFDNDRYSLGAGLLYELSPGLKARLRYDYGRVPSTPSRPIVESTSHTGTVGLEGDITPVWHANAFVGYRSETFPHALKGADHFGGPTFGASLRRDLVSGATVTIGGARATQLSAYEQNAFYIADTVFASVNVPLPFAIALTAGASYQWNDYRTNAQGLSVPRQDRMFGWTVGLARSLTRWAFARVDYVRDHRDSNVAALSNRTYSFMAQLGLHLPSPTR